MTDKNRSSGGMSKSVTADSNKAIFLDFDEDSYHGRLKGFSWNSGQDVDLEWL